MRSIRRLVAVLALLAGLSTGNSHAQAIKTAFTDAEVMQTWRQAKVFLPNSRTNPHRMDGLAVDGTHPVVLFLHGCSGIDNNSLAWGEFLSGEGVVAVLLDSFALPGRTAFCDRQTKTRLEAHDAAILDLRAREIRFARRQMQTASWADNRQIFLMGHDEGGRVVTGVFAIPFSGVIATGYKCVRDTRVVARVPMLFVNHADDPWFPGAKSSCGRIVQARENAREVLLDGAGHESSGSEVARSAVAAFLLEHSTP